MGRCQNRQEPTNAPPCPVLHTTGTTPHPNRSRADDLRTMHGACTRTPTDTCPGCTECCLPGRPVDPHLWWSSRRSHAVLGGFLRVPWRLPTSPLCQGLTCVSSTNHSRSCATGTLRNPDLPPRRGRFSFELPRCPVPAGPHPSNRLTTAHPRERGASTGVCPGEPCLAGDSNPVALPPQRIWLSTCQRDRSPPAGR